MVQGVGECVAGVSVIKMVSLSHCLRRFALTGFRVWGIGVPRTYENAPPPQDQHRALGIELLWGRGGGGVLMSEVPL